jgi:hypothetical protein
MVIRHKPASIFISCSSSSSLVSFAALVLFGGDNGHCTRRVRSPPPASQDVEYVSDLRPGARQAVGAPDRFTRHRMRPLLREQIDD